MAITSYTTTRVGRVTIVTVTSDLGGTIYYHWYADGSWLGLTTDPSITRVLDSANQEEIVAQDTNDADYDPIANAPVGWPGKQTLHWTAPADTDVDHYVVEQKKDAGSWVELGTVADDGSWSYTFQSPRLTDLADYTWRITPVDTAGNSGTPTTVGPEKIVRMPDAPDYEISFDPGTLKVTYTAAA